MNQIPSGNALHRRFLLILTLFVIAVMIHACTLPIMEGSDEILHIAYVQYLRSEYNLPDRTTSLTNCTRQESGQPPLTYWIGALVLNILDRSTTPCQDARDHYDAVKNLWQTPPNRWNRQDNLNTWLAVDDPAFAPPAAMLNNVRILRLVALLFGIVAVIGAYGAAREIFSREAWVLLTVVIFTFMPMFVHLSAYFNNDISAVAFSVLIFWQTLRLLRLGVTTKRLLITGLLLGLGGLVKVNVLLVLPAVGIALLFDWRKHNRSFWLVCKNSLLLSLPIMLTFGPWMLYGIIAYQDPIGFTTHNHPTLNHNPPLNLRQTLVLLPEVYLTYIGKFGWGSIYLRPLTYTTIGTVLALALLGYLSQVRRLRGVEFSSRLLAANLKVQQAITLGTGTLAIWFGFSHWLRRNYFVTGRLLYPAHIVFALGIAGGLALLSRHRSHYQRPLLAYTVGIFATVGVIVTTISVYGAFQPPRRLTAGQLPVLQGPVLTYDNTIRFLGYHQASSRLTGSTHTITLCWQVIAPPERRAAFSIKFIQNGQIAADRTSINGLGHYDSSRWAVGDIFCDAVDIHLADHMPPGQVYDVILVLLDAATLVVDWQATAPDGGPVDIPIIAQVASPLDAHKQQLPAHWQPAAISFPDFATLQGYDLTGTFTPGQTLQLQMQWTVLGQTAENWSQFIHLIGPGTALVLADGPPRAGDYPTWAWSPGETIRDSWLLTMPEGMPPGDYWLNIGFHRPDNGERMPATQAGANVPDASVPLLNFSIPPADD